MYAGATPCPIRAPLVVVIVGQPCRGKSLAAHKVARQLCWKGEKAKGKKSSIQKKFFLHTTHNSFVKKYK